MNLVKLHLTICALIFAGGNFVFAETGDKLKCPADSLNYVFDPNSNFCSVMTNQDTIEVRPQGTAIVAVPGDVAGTWSCDRVNNNGKWRSFMIPAAGSADGKKTKEDFLKYCGVDSGNSKLVTDPDYQLSCTSVSKCDLCAQNSDGSHKPPTVPMGSAGLLDLCVGGSKSFSIPTQDSSGAWNWKCSNTSNPQQGLTSDCSAAGTPAPPKTPTCTTSPLCAAAPPAACGWTNWAPWGTPQIGVNCMERDQHQTTTCTDPNTGQTTITDAIVNSQKKCDCSDPTKTWDGQNCVTKQTCPGNQVWSGSSCGCSSGLVLDSNGVNCVAGSCVPATKTGWFPASGYAAWGGCDYNNEPGYGGARDQHEAVYCGGVLQSDKIIGHQTCCCCVGVPPGGSINCPLASGGGSGGGSSPPSPGPSPGPVCPHNCCPPSTWYTSDGVHGACL